LEGQSPSVGNSEGLFVKRLVVWGAKLQFSLNKKLNLDNLFLVMFI